MQQITSSASEQSVHSQPAIPSVADRRSAGAAAAATGGSARLLSLDALRGFDMIWITGFGGFVNALAKYWGSPGLVGFVARQTEHGPWTPPDYGRWAQGCTFWDLIMPLFLFCTGTSLPFSMAKRRQLGQSTARIYTHLVIRVLVLWILGTIAQGNLLAFNISKLRLFSNTLQAIALGYLIAAVAYLHFKVRGQIVIASALLLIYWALLSFIPAPGAVSSEVLPNQNIAAWVDKIILGSFDDGLPYTWILSGLGFGGSVMLGVFAGQWVRSSQSPKTKVLGLVGTGFGLIAAGLLWSGWSPIIKYLWTSSMVLWWGGWSVLLLGIFYWLIDVLGWRKGAFPFVVVGCNAIFAYMIVHFVSFSDIASRLVGGLKHLLPEAYQVISAGTAFLILWLLLFWLYRTKTFFKV